VELPHGAFDALFSATAFHWVDPAVGWSKAARIVRPGGVLALLTYVGGLNLEPDVEQGFRAAWRAVLPEAATWEPRDAKAIWKGAEARRENVSELWAWLERREIARPDAAELFEDVRSPMSRASARRRRQTGWPSSAPLPPTSGSTPAVRSC
jgi:SAM-dependent methyltransferase